jgi:O-antigen ligase/polysaccharide polymerase Wzy-like membrane protein
VALAGVCTVTAVVVAADDPVGTVSTKWKDFKKGEGEPSFKGSRLTSASFESYRSDAWRVAWGNFRRHPVAGVGADNFLQDFLLHGRSDQTPVYPHSVEFRTLSQTGLVGAFLLVGALAAALSFALPARRPGGGIAGATAGAAVVMFFYWLIHGSVDWFWEFPGLGAPAFAALGLTCAIATARYPTLGVRLPGGRRVAAAAATLGLVAGVGVVLPWLAERDLRGAKEVAADHPGQALARLHRASRLNPLSPRADQTAALVEIQRGRPDLAQRRFREALERDPRDSFSYLELAAIASSEERSADSLRLIEHARRLAPRDRVILPVRRELLRGKRVSPARVRTLILRDIDLRIGPD